MQDVAGRQDQADTDRCVSGGVKGRGEDSSNADSWNMQARMALRLILTAGSSRSR